MTVRYGRARRLAVRWGKSPEAGLSITGKVLMDGRYERFAPALPPGKIRRSSSAWAWKGSQIHLERVGESDAPVRMIVVHGAGGNAAALWPFAAHLSSMGVLVTIPDLPGYGRTVVPDPGSIRYAHWQDLLIDLIRKEHDERPLILVGASIGGLLAYDAAAATGLASALVVTCLLDPRSAAVRDRLTWHPVLSRLGGPALRLLPGPLAGLRVPIRWITDMRHIANSPALVREVLRDKRGGGGRVPLGWMRSFLEAGPLVEPEAFARTPVLMVHPAQDKWTPFELSEPFFNRIRAQKQVVMLDGCGHFPIEQPGFTRMIEAVRAVRDDIAGQAPLTGRPGRRHPLS